MVFGAFAVNTSHFEGLASQKDEAGGQSRDPADSNSIGALDAEVQKRSILHVWLCDVRKEVSVNGVPDISNSNSGSGNKSPSLDPSKVVEASSIGGDFPTGLVGVQELKEKPFVSLQYGISYNVPSCSNQFELLDVGKKECTSKLTVVDGKRGRKSSLSKVLKDDYVLEY